MTSWPSSCSYALTQIECVPGLHGHACWQQIRRPLLNRLGSSSETASIDHVAVLVERAVMAPDIPKINADRRLDLRLPARNFCDEVLPRGCVLPSVDKVAATAENHVQPRSASRVLSRCLRFCAKLSPSVVLIFRPTLRMGSALWQIYESSGTRKADKTSRNMRSCSR
jgi:hypothetical protein